MLFRSKEKCLVFISGYATIDVGSFLSIFTVIGGKNIYLRLNMSGECNNTDSVWEALQKEVLQYTI